MTEKTKFNASSTGAMREALGKQYMRQVPLEAIAAGAAALEYGAEKYANRNWEKGLPWQQMIDSLKRHVDDFERGTEFDDGFDGSGLPQVCLIMASAMMLCSSVIREIGEDDRLPPTSEEAFTPKECTNWMNVVLEDASRWRDDLANDENVESVVAEIDSGDTDYKALYNESPILSEEEFNTMIGDEGDDGLAFSEYNAFINHLRNNIGRV